MRQELELLKEEGTDSSDEGLSKKDFKERKTTRKGMIFYLKSGQHQQEIKVKSSFATDG